MTQQRWIKMSSKIKGKSQLIAKLKRLSKETSLPVRQVVAKSALKLEGDAKTLIAKGSRRNYFDIW